MRHDLERAGRGGSNDEIRMTRVGEIRVAADDEVVGNLVVFIGDAGAAGHGDRGRCDAGGGGSGVVAVISGDDGPDGIARCGVVLVGEDDVVLLIAGGGVVAPVDGPITGRVVSAGIGEGVGFEICDAFGDAGAGEEAGDGSGIGDGGDEGVGGVGVQRQWIIDN